MKTSFFRSLKVERASLRMLSPLSVALILWITALSLLDRGAAASMTTRSVSNQSLAVKRSATYTISGQVQWATPGNPAVEDATIYAGSQYSATTDNNGVYTMTGVVSGTYSLTGLLASSDPCRFTHFEPQSRSVSVPPDAVHQDFSVVEIAVDFSIDGTVTAANGDAITGVTVSATGLPDVTTNANGGFDFGFVECGNTYTVTPQKAGYTFSPSSVTFTVPEIANLHFVGTNHFTSGFLPFIMRNQ